MALTLIKPTSIDLQGLAAAIAPPKISSIAYSGDDTATLPAGGQTVTLNGTGFVTGSSVLINTTVPATTVSVASSTLITFTAPAMAAGTYILYLVSPDGSMAILAPGISYSGVPTWTTAAGTLGSSPPLSAINITLAATGDAPVTYSVASGALPAGITLNSSTGVLSGTAPYVASATTYSFVIKASDAQNQDTNRSFSITLNPVIVATGGTVTTVDGYKIHTFTTSGTFNVTSVPAGATVQYVVVGGGGGGGSNGGGGGAGGFLTGNLAVASIGYTVTIGAGGAASTLGIPGGSIQSQQVGEASIFGSLTAAGGGGGGNWNTAGGNGGSGGGAGRVDAGGGGYKERLGGIASAGYNGGRIASGTNEASSAGGGGGAGAVGGGLSGYGPPDGGYPGGAGLANPIAGSTIGQLVASTYYLAGGGSGTGTGFQSGTSVGGIGGGGSSTGGASAAGQTNTGGGGGGGGNMGSVGAGGSGVVIIRYLA